MTLDAILNVILLVCAIGAVGQGYLKVARRLELRLRDRARVRDLGLPAAAQRPAELAETDPRGIRLDPGRVVLPRLRRHPAGRRLDLVQAHGLRVELDDPRWSLVVPVVALLAYIWRVVVEDKKPLQWSLPAPTTPEEEAAHARRRPGGDHRLGPALVPPLAA